MPNQEQVNAISEEMAKGLNILFKAKEAQWEPARIKVELNRVRKENEVIWDLSFKRELSRIARCYLGIEI